MIIIDGLHKTQAIVFQLFTNVIVETFVINAGLMIQFFLRGVVGGNYWVQRNSLKGLIVIR